MVGTVGPALAHGHALVNGALGVWPHCNAVMLASIAATCSVMLLSPPDWPLFHLSTALHYKPAFDGALAAHPACVLLHAFCCPCICKLLPAPPAEQKCCCTPCQAPQAAPPPLGVQGQWHTRAGSFKSIMAIVTPCRSDQSTLGLAPYSHLSDGRIQLVLVKECSILQYLQFLASIPQSGGQGWGSRGRHSSSSMAVPACWVLAGRLALSCGAAFCSFGHTAPECCLEGASTLRCRCSAWETQLWWQCLSDAGVVPGKFSYVDIVEATAVHVEPVGKESRWNVDGELLETNHVNAQVRGLLDWAAA